MTDLFEEPSGRKFWNRNPIRNRIFNEPDELMKAAYGYFDWVDDNPLSEEKVFGTGFRAEVKKVRAMGVNALCVHIGMARSTWFDYKKADRFKEVCEHISQVMDAYNFEVAVAGLANANIIARQIGLPDRTLHGSDPENPLPENVVTLYQLPDNGRD